MYDDACRVTLVYGTRTDSPANGSGTLGKFMDIHHGFVGVAEVQLKAAHDANLAIEAEEGVHFEHAWLDPDSGKVFCLSTGPSREAVMRVHQRAGHPTTEVYEVPIEV